MEPRALDNLQSLQWFLPELALMGGVLLVLAWDLFVRGRAKVPGVAAISLATLGYAGAQSLAYALTDEPPRLLFEGLLSSDRFAHAFRALFAAVTAVIVVFALPEHDDRRQPETQRASGEFYLLLLTVTLGMNLMAMSHNLLMLYLSLELVSVISFVLAGFKIADRHSAEAALKYVVFGGVASGVLLYGASWLFGITQSLDLGIISERLVHLTDSERKVPAAVVVAVVCMLAGFGYKISAAPFHMWTPDVYEGAPTTVTAFLSVGPKAAGFALLIRFFTEALGVQASASADVASPWPVLVGVLAMATMSIGNLSALAQSSVKRMLAYSSVAHAGYMLLGFCAFSETGTAAILFYIVTYCLMNLGAFVVVEAVADRSGGDETLAAFRGLGGRAPILAASMAVFLFSLTGLPPFAGFVGKFYIFAALVRSGGSLNWILLIVGVLNSVISLFYYVKVIRAMYLTPSHEGSGAILPRVIYSAATVALAVPTLALGIYWGPIYDFVAASASLSN